nr:MAG TPA: hypothetical protein [Caudoviricetes sp.]
MYHFFPFQYLSYKLIYFTCQEFFSFFIKYLFVHKIFIIIN